MGSTRSLAVVLLSLLLLSAGCNGKSGSIESISMDFPMGATRLLARSNGEAFLLYGALPPHGTVRKGTFDIDRLYKQLHGALHDNVPREEWPDPKAAAGMVTINFVDEGKKDYLIFDRELAEGILEKARRNIIEKETSL